MLVDTPNPNFTWFTIIHSCMIHLLGQASFKLIGSWFIMKFHWLDKVHFKSLHTHLFLDGILWSKAHSHGTISSIFFHPWSFHMAMVNTGLVQSWLSLDPSIPHSCFIDHTLVLDSLAIGHWSLSIQVYFTPIHFTFNVLVGGPLIFGSLKSCYSFTFLPIQVVRLLGLTFGALDAHTTHFHTSHFIL